mgnify:CR=1 FL=1
MKLKFIYRVETVGQVVYRFAEKPMFQKVGLMEAMEVEAEMSSFGRQVILIAG